MKQKLKFKFILGFFFFGLLTFLFISTRADSLIQDTLIKHKAAYLYDNALSISNECISLYETKMESLTKYETELKWLATGLDAEVWLTDTNGNIIYDTKNIYKGKVISNFDPVNFNKDSKYDLGYLQTGNFHNMFSHTHISVMAPIHANYITRGYILIHYPISKLDSDKYDILNIIYISAIVMYLFSFIILIIFYLCVSKPLKQIIKAADVYAGGDLSYKCPVKSNDEMGYLSATLNYMASELNNTEEYQRNFISNVSHDFRSPLTLIRGYLIAILDGTIPPELYEKYINIVIKETDRLKKLTESILTLNQINTPGNTTLNMSVFDINQAIKDTCASFEGICRSKNLQFDLVISSKTLMVKADFGKIQQVLYNLIDNAIKFSKENSTIKITSYSLNEKVFVSVRDYGCGISKDNIKKIFERFYKADNSRGRDRQGTGLGLAIVKDIMNAHGEPIDVISTPDVGTEFTFTLKKES